MVREGDLVLRSSRRLSCAAVVVAVALAGCFDAHGPPPIDGRDRLPDPSRGDAGTAEELSDAGLDARAPDRARDAGPLPAPRGTVLALAFDAVEDTSTIHELDEDGIVLSVPVPREPRPRPIRHSLTLHVARDGSWHVIETVQLSGARQIEGFVRRYDPDRGEWTRRELPAELRSGSDWAVLPDGAEDIFAVQRADDVRLVRWGASGIVAEGRVPIERDARAGGPFAGGDGLVYLVSSGPASGMLYAVDPITLEIVRILEPDMRGRSPRVDVDGSVVMFADVSERLIRWRPDDGTLTSGDRRAGTESVVSISRDGRILARDRVGGAVLEYSQELRRARNWALPATTPGSATSWAWADPAAR